MKLVVPTGSANWVTSLIERTGGVGGNAGTAAENSDVLPSASVAVAVTIWLAVSATLKVGAKETVPLVFVVTLVKPMNVCPSACPPAGSGLLAKNSTRNVVFAVWLSE